jgi:C_GCAxxG_C_C family probable redox protein
MTRKEKAIHIFNSGNNCAQSVIGAFEDKVNHKKEILIDVSSGFGGGMGRLQQTCGAVTGAFMVLSFINSNGPDGSKELLTNNIQEFAARFNKKFGAMNCKELIPYNLQSEKERELAKRDGVFKNKCTEYVASAVDMIENILQEQ